MADKLAKGRQKQATLCNGDCTGKRCQCTSDQKARFHVEEYAYCQTANFECTVPPLEGGKQDRPVIPRGKDGDTKLTTEIEKVRNRPKGETLNYLDIFHELRVHWHFFDDIDRIDRLLKEIKKKENATKMNTEATEAKIEASSHPPSATVDQLLQLNGAMTANIQGNSKNIADNTKNIAHNTANIGELTTVPMSNSMTIT